MQNAGESNIASDEFLGLAASVLSVTSFLPLRRLPREAGHPASVLGTATHTERPKQSSLWLTIKSGHPKRPYSVAQPLIIHPALSFCRRCSGTSSRTNTSSSWARTPRPGTKSSRATKGSLRAKGEKISENTDCPTQD